jgi:heat shock protein HtpX
LTLGRASLHQRLMNIIRTGLLMAGLTALFLFGGYLAGGGAGLAIAFVFAAGASLYAYWNADRVLLSMVGAREATDATALDLVHLVRRLAGRAGLPMPRVYVVENDQPNAFATGRNPQHAAVCVTSGLLARVTPEELAGVLAHELGHVKHRDTLAATIMTIIASTVSMLAGGERRGALGFAGLLLASILAPVASVMMQLSASRTREYEADRAGAEICGHPLWLASALRTIAWAATDNPWTHPATADRIARLRAIAGRAAAQVGAST